MQASRSSAGATTCSRATTDSSMASTSSSCTSSTYPERGTTGLLTHVFIHICTNNSLRYNYRDVLNIYLVYLTIHFHDEESYFMDCDAYTMKEAHKKEHEVRFADPSHLALHASAGGCHENCRHHYRAEDLQADAGPQLRAGHSAHPHLGCSFAGGVTG